MLAKSRTQRFISECGQHGANDRRSDEQHAQKQAAS
jgi:hypothetical protein